MTIRFYGLAALLIQADLRHHASPFLAYFSTFLSLRALPQSCTALLCGYCILSQYFTSLTFVLLSWKLKRKTEGKYLEGVVVIPLLMAAAVWYRSFVENNSAINSVDCRVLPDPLWIRLDQGQTFILWISRDWPCTYSMFRKGWDSDIDKLLNS